MSSLKAGDAFHDFVGPLGCPSEICTEDLNELKKKNPMMFAVLKQSDAYIDGDVVLIKCSNPDFISLMREGTKNRTDIKNAIMSVTGKTYRLGPYKPEVQKENRKEPFDVLVENLKSNKLI